MHISDSHDQDQIHQVQDQQLASSTQLAQSSSSTQRQIVQLVITAIDHPLDQIVKDLRSGVQTMLDIGWINVMHEEISNFTRNEVCELVERPKNYNVIGTK